MFTKKDPDQARDNWIDQTCQKLGEIGKRPGVTIFWPLPALYDGTKVLLVMCGHQALLMEEKGKDLVVFKANSEFKKNVIDFIRLFKLNLVNKSSWQWADEI